MNRHARAIKDVNVQIVENTYKNLLASEIQPYRNLALTNGEPIIYIENDDEDFQKAAQNSLRGDTKFGFPAGGDPSEERFFNISRAKSSADIG